MPKCRDTLRILLAGAGLVGIGAEVHADIPTGIVGGYDLAGNAYTAFILQSGALAPVAGESVGTTINATAMNLSGFSLIGGRDFNSGSGYAATVSSTGTLTPLPLVLTGNITNVALSPSNNTGLIAGTNFTTMTGFAAFVLPDGTIFPASGFADVNANVFAVDAVAINCSNVGLIGAEGDDTNPYAAYVAPDGTVTPITIPPQFDIAGSVNSVAINKQGVGIIGGNNLGVGAFAAYVTQNGGAVAFSIPLAATDYIDAVAINNAGLGLIGGVVNGLAYAAYGTQQGVLTPLISTPFTGSINSVALNSSGAGIIGGGNGPNIYAALVQPSGSVTPVNTGVIGGQINSVAISDTGIGLIGGVDNDTSTAYAALVAPNGAVTPLDVSAAGAINGVDVSGKASCSQPSILAQAAPASMGPYHSVIYTQLAASYALDTRFIEQHYAWTHEEQPPFAALEFKEDELLASIGNHNTLRPKSKKQPAPAYNEPNSVWIAPFGNYLRTQEQGKVPNFTNKTAGLLLAYDHLDCDYLVGTCLGYAFNYVGYGQGLGHGKIQEELACFYGSYFNEYFRLNGAVWGGLYQFRNTRYTLSTIKSKGKTHGWILSPHLEITSPWAIDQDENYLIEPFLKFDWSNHWQHRFTETGKSGFNLKIRDIYNSLLQSEVGLRFYERFAYRWGHFCLEEKISYVNQAPFKVSPLTTAFVGAASSFPIAIASNKVESLGAVQLIGSFVPRDTSYPYGGFSLQATANGSYQSYYGSLFLGIDF